MGDPYLEKLELQRDKWVNEMPNCPQCLANPESRTPIVDHIWDHSKPEVSIPTSDANIEYDHDAPAEHYPYKSKGMTDAAAMHPSRWKQKESSENLPGSYEKPSRTKEPEMSEGEFIAALKVSTKIQKCAECGENFRLWSYHVSRCGKGVPA